MARFWKSAVIGCAVAVVSGCSKTETQGGAGDTASAAAANPSATVTPTTTQPVAVPGDTGQVTLHPTPTTTPPPPPNDSGQVTLGGKTAAKASVIHHIPNDSGQIVNKKLTP